MSQDIVSDGLNEIMNAKRVEKREIVIRRSSKLLVRLLEIMKEKGHLDFEIVDGELRVKILKLAECHAIKPRYFVNSNNLERYLRRFLPSRRFGTLIISTDKGLLDQKGVITNNVGGALIAYFY